MNYKETLKRNKIIFAERRRRNAAIKNAVVALRACCAECARGDITTGDGRKLCKIECCSIYDALMRRGVEIVKRDSDYASNPVAEIDASGVLRCARGGVGRPRRAQLVDDIRL